MCNMSPESACQGALKMLDVIDTQNKETQLIALGLTLLAYCRRHRVDVGDIFTVANNMLHSATIQSTSHEALQNYITYEL